MIARSASANGKIRVALLELTGERHYLPLAAGYLKAYALADDEIARNFIIKLVLEHYQVPIDQLMTALTEDGIPDVAGISCQGWAVPHADEVARLLRALNPGILIIYGGNHVSHEGAAFFAERDYADVLVNGEGEATFSEILRRYLHADALLTLEGCAGLSYRAADGTVVLNADRPRIESLDELPSPYLTGVLDGHLQVATTALLETNRGCPYHCSYCYWGQAVGQRLHKFTGDRLRSEMIFLAERGVDSWYICDANFGILPQDAELVEEIVRLRQHYGVPRTVHTNWAKNSNRRIVELCAQLNMGGVHSTYTLALQSATEGALQLANRTNMKINRIDEIAQLCRSHGVIPRGELIWGMPGEDFADFCQSYEILSDYTDALSVYPLYVLPNTQYSKDAKALGIVTERAEADTDYEYCVQHNQMTYADFLTGLRFIVSNNILKVGSSFFRLYPRIAKTTAGIPYHRTIGDLGDWIAASDHPMAARFKKFYADPVALHRQSLTEVWMAVRRDRAGVLGMFETYVEEALHSSMPDRAALPVLRQALRFDVATYPLVDSRQQEEQEGETGSYAHAEHFDFDFLSVQRGGADIPRAGTVSYLIRHPAGLWRYPLENWYFGLAGFQATVERAA